MFWQRYYNIIVIPAARILIPVVGFFDRKMRRGINGRVNLLKKLEKEVALLKPSTREGGSTPRVWFHSSSMGEFEQAKPIIAELRKRYSDIEIVVSFFSPSGYDHSRNYKYASIITYIPFDTPGDARKFIGILKPTVAIMVRYDVWPNHIWELKRQKVPTFIANATLSEHSSRLLPVLKQFHYALYNAIDYILTVSESDARMFGSFKLEHSIIKPIGDTRYDQVIQRSAEARNRRIIPETVTAGKHVVVVGSSWEEDEAQLLPALYRVMGEQPDILVILAPHEPNEDNLERIEKSLNGHSSAIRFSAMGDYRNERFIIVDSIGILMALYGYADIVYVGGSFRQGVHNVLEPAVYGVPILVGPRHDNSQEAKTLAGLGALMVGGNEDELYEHLHLLLTDEAKRKKAGSIAYDYVNKNAGATERFLSYLEKTLETKRTQ